ncbi:MAG: ATP-binding cassette domain-containing protein, partial [Candidatus Odinarchaeota archaeon]
MLECEKIQFKYGTKLILEDISIQFKKGYLYGILGPNGSGKTTLIKILSGILKQNFGKVFVNELDIKNLRIRDLAKELAVVNQSNKIEFDFTVSEIVKMGRFSHIGRFSRESAEDKRIINKIL